MSDTFAETHPRFQALPPPPPQKKKRKKKKSIWIPYPGSHTLATQPGTSFPLKVVEGHNHSPLHITMSACQWGANDRAALWDGRTVGEPRDTSEWVAGGCPGGGSATPTKSHWGRERGRGTRLAPVLLPFRATVGGGCYLVLTEWTDYFRRIGGRRFIIAVLYSVNGHYVHFATLYILSLGNHQWVLHIVLFPIPSHHECGETRHCDVTAFVVIWQSNHCQISVSHIGQIRCRESYDEVRLHWHCLLPWKSKTIGAISEWVTRFCCYPHLEQNLNNISPHRRPFGAFHTRPICHCVSLLPC